MDKKRYDDGRRTGSVEGNFSLDKPKEKFSSREKELHKARGDTSRYKESRRAAESEKVKAESELLSARKTVKDMASMIEESNSKANAKMRGTMEPSTKNQDLEHKALDEGSIESYWYGEVLRELELVKQELSKLKLDMAAVMGEKERAEKDFEDSRLRMWSNAISIQKLRKQIEAANEEHVLAELAQIEALKEASEIEVRRGKEAGEFSFRMEETKKKMEEIAEEVAESKELEHKLDATLSDVNLLEDELKQVKKADGEENVPSLSLESITKELEAAKEELDAIKEEGFQYASSMDIIRNELKHVKEETTRLKKTEEKADMKVQSLHSKLLRANSKLEAVTAAEEKAKSIVRNLFLTLEQLRAEAEASKKEKALIAEDAATLNAEIQKTKSEIDSTEEKLEAALQELEAIKSSEASALEKLRSLIETTMQSRASASNQSSTITISKFEYEYLTGRAVGAEEIADKKVAAAQAWIEALKASEREILMKTEIAQRDLREMRAEEEHEVYGKESSVSAKKMIERELRNWKQNHEKSGDTQKRQSPFRRRSKRSSGNMTTAGRTNFRKSSSYGIKASK